MDKREKDRKLKEAMDEHGHYLTRLAYSFVKDRARAEDIIQEVFVRFYLHMEEFEKRSSAKTYLYRITVNECKNYLRSWSYRKTELTAALLPDRTTGRTTEAEVLAAERSDEVIRAIGELPGKYREVIWLYYYAELSVAEVAEVLKCSQNTVKTRLARGRKLAGIAFTEEGIDHA